MKNLVSILFSMTVALMLSSCCGSTDNNNKSEPTEVDKFSARLHGTWIWKESQGGFGGQKVTPEELGVNVQLRVDNPTKIYGLWKDEELVSTGSYSLEWKAGEQFYPDSCWEMHISPDPKHSFYNMLMFQQLVVLSGDTLTIIPQVYDGFVSKLINFGIVFE